jgi:hypothetical protein
MDRVLRIQASSQDKMQGMLSRVAMCATAPDLASLSRRAPVLPCVPWLCVSVEEGSGAATCPTASDLVSLPMRASVLPRVPWL